MPQLDPQKAPQQPQSSMQQPSRGTDYAQLGIGAGMTVITASVIAGAVAFATGHKAFFDRMFRVRMVAVATTFGFYATASGWLPPPPLLNIIMGREPRPLQAPVQLLPGRPQLQQQQQQASGVDLTNR